MILGFEISKIGPPIFGTFWTIFRILEQCAVQKGALRLEEREAVKIEYRRDH